MPLIKTVILDQNLKKKISTYRKEKYADVAALNLFIMKIVEGC